MCVTGFRTTALEKWLLTFCHVYLLLNHFKVNYRHDSLPLYTLSCIAKNTIVALKNQKQYFYCKKIRRYKLKRFFLKKECNQNKVKFTRTVPPRERASANVLADPL